ncbi:MAG: TonB C-terminal domain-containing protein [Spartobacteria bacterium]|nr:TonB C-terminal domain-containing protein [Spartobacteria bacterium]
MPRITQNDIRDLLSSELSSSPSQNTSSRSSAGSTSTTPQWYYQNIQQTMYNNWNQPTSLTAGIGRVVDVRLRINRDGSIASKRITAPSGIGALDRSVQDALDKTARLSPLPSSINEPYLDITVEFILER